jgi:hypothetical protein
MEWREDTNIANAMGKILITYISIKNIFLYV